MPEIDEQTQPAAGELRALCATLHVDPAVVRRFISNYLRLLDTRIERIERDLDGGDLNSATVGLLSLAASSSMLGAEGVAEAAEQLRQHVRAGSTAGLAGVRRSLHRQAGREQHRLSRIRAAASAP